MWDLRRSSRRWLIWDMSSQRIMLTQPCRYQWAVTTSQSFFVATQGRCALSRLLLGSVTRSFRIMDWLLFLRPHTSTVVRFDLLPLNLTGGHSRMAFWKSPDAYGSSIAANPRTLSLSKYLELATPSKESTYSLPVFASPSSGNLYVTAQIFPTSGRGFRSKRREKFLHTFLWDLSIHFRQIMTLEYFLWP